MPKLVFRGADGVEQSLDLGAEPVLIGRLSECQVQTQDAAVSRRHARIVWDGGYFVEDLGSANGVFVRGERVQRAPLRPGDDVRCGSLTLRLLPEAVWAERTKTADAPPRPSTPPRAFDAVPPAPPGPSTPPRSFDASPPPPPTSPSLPVAGNDAALLAAEQRATRAEAKLLDVEARAEEAERKLSAAEAQAREAMERARLAEQAAGDGNARLLQRKIEQLTAENRRLRQGQPVSQVDGERIAELEALLQQAEGAHESDQAAPVASRAAETEAEAERTRRMIEQLTAENRRLRQGSSPTPPAEDPRVAELQARLAAVEHERDTLRVTASASSGAVPKLGETLGLVDDTLADLRGSLRAASDEIGVLGVEAPGDSVEVLRDALSTAQEQAESARAKVKELRARVGAQA